MTISKRGVLGLLLFAWWTMFIWVTRMWNILKDDTRSTGFKAVHSVLALISIVFALWTIAMVKRNYRRP
jgi:uncharacterized membrane protein